MFYFYVIKSSKKKYYYTGYTNDLKKRVQDHNNGKTKSIKHLVPFDLIYYEAYTNKTLARKREINIKKNSAAKEQLFKQLDLL